MTVDRGDADRPQDRDGRAPATAPPEAGHLDQDPEALEDPVHRGDAQHQEQVHDEADRAAMGEPTDAAAERTD